MPFTCQKAESTSEGEHNSGCFIWRKIITWSNGIAYLSAGADFRADFQEGTNTIT